MQSTTRFTLLTLVDGPVEKRLELGQMVQLVLETDREVSVVGLRGVESEEVVITGVGYVRGIQNNNSRTRTHTNTPG